MAVVVRPDALRSRRAARGLLAAEQARAAPGHHLGEAVRRLFPDDPAAGEAAFAGVGSVLATTSPPSPRSSGGSTSARR